MANNIVIKGQYEIRLENREYSYAWLWSLAITTGERRIFFIVLVLWRSQTEFNISTDISFISAYSFSLTFVTLFAGVSSRL